MNCNQFFHYFFVFSSFLAGTNFSVNKVKIFMKKKGSLTDIQIATGYEQVKEILQIISGGKIENAQKIIVDKSYEKKITEQLQQYYQEKSFSELLNILSIVGKVDKETQLGKNNNLFYASFCVKKNKYFKKFSYSPDACFIQELINSIIKKGSSPENINIFIKLLNILDRGPTLIFNNVILNMIEHTVNIPSAEQKEWKESFESLKHHELVVILNRFYIFQKLKRELPENELRNIIKKFKPQDFNTCMAEFFFNFLFQTFNTINISKLKSINIKNMGFYKDDNIGSDPIEPISRQVKTACLKIILQYSKFYENSCKTLNIEEEKNNQNIIISPFDTILNVWRFYHDSIGHIDIPRSIKDDLENLLPFFKAMPENTKFKVDEEHKEYIHYIRLIVQYMQFYKNEIKKDPKKDAALLEKDLTNFLINNSKHIAIFSLIDFFDFYHIHDKKNSIYDQYFSKPLGILFLHSFKFRTDKHDNFFNSLFINNNLPEFFFQSLVKVIFFLTPSDKNMDKILVKPGMKKIIDDDNADIDYLHLIIKFRRALLMLFNADTEKYYSCVEKENFLFKSFDQAVNWMAQRNKKKLLSENLETAIQNYKKKLQNNTSNFMLILKQSDFILNKLHMINQDIQLLNKIYAEYQKNLKPTPSIRSAKEQSIEKNLSSLHNIKIEKIEPSQEADNNKGKSLEITPTSRSKKKRNRKYQCSPSTQINDSLKNKDENRSPEQVTHSKNNISHTINPNISLFAPAFASIQNENLADPKPTAYTKIFTNLHTQVIDNHVTIEQQKETDHKNNEHQSSNQTIDSIINISKSIANQNIEQSNRDTEENADEKNDINDKINVALNKIRILGKKSISGLTNQIITLDSQPVNSPPSKYKLIMIIKNILMTIQAKVALLVMRIMVRFILWRITESK